MTITPITGTIIDPSTNVALPTEEIKSSSPYVYVRYNTVTKAIIGKVIYCPGSTTGSTTATGGILACDDYANLQTAVTSAALTGTLSADPTPKHKT